MTSRYFQRPTARGSLELWTFWSHFYGLFDFLTLSLPECLMEFCTVTLTFESADEILWCDYSNESSSAVLSRGTICFSKFYKMKFGNLVEICLWLHLAVKGLKYRRKELATCPVPDLLIVYTWQHWNLSPNKSCIIKTGKIVTATPLDKYLRTVKRACVVLKH